MVSDESSRHGFEPLSLLVITDYDDMRPTTRESFKISRDSILITSRKKTDGLRNEEGKVSQSVCTHNMLSFK
jgi:hypothetical protein